MISWHISDLGMMSSLISEFKMNSSLISDFWMQSSSIKYFKDFVIRFRINSSLIREFWMILSLKQSLVISEFWMMSRGDEWMMKSDGRQWWRRRWLCVLLVVILVRQGCILSSLVEVLCLSPQQTQIECFPCLKIQNYV